MKSKVLLYPYSLWLSMFTIVPLILVVFFAFTDKSNKFTFNNLLEVGKYSYVFLNSIFLGAIATIICLLLGYPFAYIIFIVHIKYRGIAIMLIMLPMWMNFLLRTYAWMTLLENNGLINNLLSLLKFKNINLINTRGAVVLGMVYNFLPYMILPIYSTIIKIDKKIVEAAQDLGAGKKLIFTKILLPLSLPGIISGVTMVFVPAVSTFIISKMLGGGSNILIGDLIEMQFLGNSYNPHLGSAISLVLMVLILLCMGIMNQFTVKDKKEKRRNLK